MNAIDAEKIRATVKYLSDDALQGRGTGQKGGDMAADWIAAQFKSYGLMPAGDQGTYFQQVNFFGVTTDPKQTQFAFVPKSGPEMHSNLPMITWQMTRRTRRSQRLMRRWFL